MLNNRYNFFLFARNIFFTLWYADWEGAYQRSGILGLLAEFFRSLVGVNAWPFFIDSKGGWDRKKIQKLFAPYGIKMWGWGYSQGKFFFRVKKRQAHWSQHILLEQGVPIRGRLLEGYSNTNSPSLSKGTKASSAKQENKQQSQARSQSKTSKSNNEPFNLLNEINNLVDKLDRL